MNRYQFVKLIIFLSIFAFLNWKCTKKNTINKTNNVALKYNATLPPFHFLSDELWSVSSPDSMYEMHFELELNPSPINVQILGAFDWNEQAGTFITRGNFTAFNKNLEKVFVDESTFGNRILAYRNEPLAINANEKTLNIVDLKAKKVLRRYPIKGSLRNVQQLLNDQILANVIKDKKSIYQYFFEGSKLVKIDSIEVEYALTKFSFSPDLKYFVYEKYRDLVLKNLANGIEKSISIGNDFGEPIFSDDGQRIIIKEFTYSSLKSGKVTIMSFPEMEKIWEAPFKDPRVVSLTDSLMIVGDQIGKLVVVNINNGKVVFQQKTKKIYGAGIALPDIIAYSEKSGNKINFYTKNIRENKIIKKVSSNSKTIKPMVVSNDSKLFYFFYDKKIYGLDLTSKEYHQVPSPTIIRNLGDSKINSNDSILAFKVSGSWNTHIELLDISSGKKDRIAINETKWFFGKNPNELIIYNQDSTNIYNIKTKKWSPALAKTLHPRFSSIRQPLVWKDHFDKDKIIYQASSENSGQLHIAHFNQKTFESKDSVIHFKNQKDRKDLIGVDRNGDYYLIKKRGIAYRYERGSLNMVDSIPGNFYRYSSMLESTRERDVFHSDQNGRSVLFSPTEPFRYQFLNVHDYIWLTPDLEYVIQTRGDKIRVYRWRKE